MLNALLPELLDQIISLLDVSDLCSLRLACRRLEQQCRRAFATDAFSTLRFDFSPESLRYINNIASHDDFRLCVRKLRVGNWGALRKDGGWKLSYEVPLGDKGHWPRQESGYLDLGSGIIKAFSDDISRFVNCRAVTITDDRGRLPEREATETSLSVTDAVHLLLHALAASSAPPIQCFRIRINRLASRMRAEEVSKATIDSPELRSHWPAHLQELIIEYNAFDDDYLEMMLDLLTACSNLRTLRLMWHALGRDNSMNSCGYHLGRHLGNFPKFAPPLVNLSLGMMTMRETDLAQLLSNCQDSLTNLHFHRLTLSPGSWKNVLEHLHATPFPRLQRFALSTCTEGERGDFVVFCPLFKYRALQQSCGGNFEFAVDRTTSGEKGRKVRVTGVSFSSKTDTSAMKTALQSMMEKHHIVVYKRGPSPGCPPRSELRASGADLVEVRMNKVPQYERWTGLTPKGSLGY